MALPFTQTEFLDVFGTYNRAWWPAEVALWIATLGGAVQILRGRTGAIGIGILLAVHWAWSGVIYHAMYFSSINPAAWAFAALFVVQAVLFVWAGPMRRKLTFEWTWSLGQVLAAVFLVLGLAYPIGSIVFGQATRTPLFAVPCPTTLFTAGVLLAAAPPVPRRLFIIPIAWSFIGGTASLTMGIPPDMALFGAGAAMLVAVAAPSLLHGHALPRKAHASH